MSGPAIIGLLVGSFLAVVTLSMILEFAIFKRVMDDPVKGKVGSVLAALVLIEIIYAWSSHARPIYPIGAGCYFLAAVVWGTIAYSRGVKAREYQYEDSGEAEHYDQTFG